MDKTTNKILAERIKNGDISSFEKVFRMYYSKLLSFVNRIVLSKEIAKDITQEVFVKFWINRSKINSDHSCIGLLYTMARNAALDYLRSKLRSFIPLAGEILDDHEADLDNSETTNPEVMQKKIEDCLSKLPSQQQKVFFMGKVEQMSNKEIAETLDISIRTVEKHMELAKRKIKNNLT